MASTVRPRTDENRRHLKRTLPLLSVLALLFSILPMGSPSFDVIAQDDGTADMPIYRGNAARTGVLPGSGPDLDAPDFGQLWTREVSPQVDHTPIVADGTVYLFGQYRSKLVAMDLATGRTRWSFDFGQKIGDLTVSDGTVYVMGAYNFWAIDSETGQENWIVKLPVSEYSYSSPVVVDGSLYFLKNDEVYAFDAATGQQRWSETLSGGVFESVAVVDGVIYVSGFYEWILTALDAATGNQLWVADRLPRAQRYVGSSTPAVVDGVVYLADGWGISAYDTATGQNIWGFEPDDPDRDTTASAGKILSLKFSAPAVANGVVYTGADDHHVYAIDAVTGQQKWAFPTEDVVSASPVIVDGVVFIGSEDGYLYLLDAETGTQREIFATGSPILGDVTVLDGVAYFFSGNSDGADFYALGNTARFEQTVAAATEVVNATATGVAAEAATSVAEAALAASGSVPDVPMFRGGPARTGAMPGPGPNYEADDFQMLWSFETGSRSSGMVEPSPVLVDGVIYIGGNGRQFYALDATSGHTLWISETSGSYTTAAVANGMVYVGRSGALVAFDATTGEERWTFEGVSDESSPIVLDGVVYMAGDEQFYAVDAATGQRLWVTTNLASINSTSPAIYDDVLYAGRWGRSVVASNLETGQELWKIENDEPIFDRTPAIADGVLYIGSQNRIYAIDLENHETRWSFASRGAEFSTAAAVADGTVYVGSESGLVFAIDAETGLQKWAYQTGDTVRSAPSVAGGVVYFGSDNGYFFAVAAVNGKLLWWYQTDGPIDSSPVIADGIVYVHSEDGRLSAFGNPSPELATATAVANLTATAAAAVIATARAEEDAAIGATATAETEIRIAAETEMERWQDYFWRDINDEFATGVGAIPGMSLADHGDRDGSIPLIPEGYDQGAQYRVSIAGGSAGASVNLLIFPSKGAADTAMETMSGGLARSGWESRKGDGLKHNNACLTVVHTSSAEAVCYVTRDDALIVSYSSISLPNPDAALANAIDLAQVMSDTYDEVDRPD